MKVMKTFVKYDGLRPSVVLNGANANPYHFLKGHWIEMHENDIPAFQKRCERNAAWEIKTDEQDAVETRYFVRFMGVGDKKKKEEISHSMTFHERDIRGVIQEGESREYEFPMEEWVEINEVDKARFKVKGDANAHWEYDKRIMKVEVASVELDEETKAKIKAEAEAKVAADAKIKTDAEAVEKARLEAVAKAKIEAEEKAKTELEKEEVMDKDKVTPSSTEETSNAEVAQ